MKVTLVFLILNIGFCFSQNKTQTIPGKVLQKQELKFFLDSLKSKVLADTIKFNRKDLLHWNIGSTNTKPYSSLFVIENYQYKLDIIKGNLVNQFVNEILQYDKIENVTLFSKENGIMLFGDYGKCGVIWITPKKKAKFNFKIAGLNKKKKRKVYTNFEQRQDSEIKVLY